jgi:hypothetical protein
MCRRRAWCGALEGVLLAFANLAMGCSLVYPVGNLEGQARTSDGGGTDAPPVGDGVECEGKLCALGLACCFDRAICAQECPAGDNPFYCDEAADCTPSEGQGAFCCGVLGSNGYLGSAGCSKTPCDGGVIMCRVDTLGPDPCGDAGTCQPGMPYYAYCR